MSFMRKADANQPEIVLALRKAGCTVQHLHAVGKGCPDLLCAVNGHVFLVEVKDGAKPRSKQQLTPDQIEWHAWWGSPVHVVNSVEAALAVVAHYKAEPTHLKETAPC